MKTLFASVFLLLGNLGAAEAQVSVPPPSIPEKGYAAPDFSGASAGKLSLSDSLSIAESFSSAARTPDSPSAPSVDTTLRAEGDPAEPAPKPKFIYGGRDDYRWQLNLSFTFMHFQSSVFDSNPVGVKTTLTYFTNDWFGIEGSFTGAFGSAVLNTNQDAKIAIYGGGPKVAWRQKRWEPWIHAIFGGAHEDPQTGAGNRTSYSITAGGGGDYRWNPRISFRAEGNYVRTAFFHQGQNNIQLAGGVVFHF